MNKAVYQAQSPPKKVPLIVGEILFDCFPDGQRVMGGAPFNIACHLAAFGQHPLLITRLGQDEAGREALQKMGEWGLSLGGVQFDSAHPTGRVEITLSQGEPTFDIQPDQAFDFLELPPVLAEINKRALAIFYHGTLIARSPAGRRIVESLTRDLRLPRFVDVNLRDPWWTVEAARVLSRKALWLKLNESELQRLAPASRNCGSPGDSALQGKSRWGVDDVPAITALMTELEAANVLVTAADRGARMVGSWEPELNIRLESPPVTRLQDTVGAGDALTAVTLLGLIQGWSIELTFRRGLHFASAICAIRGAVPQGREFYEPFLKEWRIDAPR